MDGAPIAKRIPGYEVGPATESDLSACNSLCLRVHGHDRGGELHDAIKQGTAKVVEHLGRITGYATDLAFFAHAAGETNQAMIALIASAFDISSKGGILVPTRNGELFRRQVCSRRFVIETDRHQRHLMHQAQTIVQATSSTSKFKYSLQVSAARP